MTRVNPKSDPGGAGEAGEVGSQSIAEIEHGGGELVAHEPLALGKARVEGEVAPGPGTAQLSRDEKEVARLGSRAVG